MSVHALALAMELEIWQNPSASNRSASLVALGLLGFARPINQSLALAVLVALNEIPVHREAGSSDRSIVEWPGLVSILGIEGGSCLRYNFLLKLNSIGQDRYYEVGVREQRPGRRARGAEHGRREQILRCPRKP